MTSKKKTRPGKLERLALLVPCFPDIEKNLQVKPRALWVDILDAYACLRTFLLSVLLITFSGCIVTYRDFPNPTLESLPKDHEPKPLYYHVEPIITQEWARALSQDEARARREFSRAGAGIYMSSGVAWYGLVPQIDPIGQPGRHEVARTLNASGMFSGIVETAGSPETGVYCNVDFEVRSGPDWVTSYDAAVPMFWPLLITNVLPYYVGEGGTTVVYRLSRDGQLKQTYRYPITKEGAGWIVLLPFAWLNFFTNDLKDAVRGTTLQFLIDAQRDGNL